MISLTDSAIKAVSRFIRGSERTVIGLRVRVEGGGCSGFKYGIKLEDTQQANDEVVELGGIKVLIDPDSAPLLVGVTIDFLDNLQGTGFTFSNPNAAQSCGCGKSFSC